jgi:hypothetical protein
MAPITRASGTRRTVLARHARNRRLADALYRQAFAALGTSPGARDLYDQQRARDATHHQALRPRQSAGRHPARLPAPPHPLRRDHRLAHRHESRHRGRLTSYDRGMSEAASSETNPKLLADRGNLPAVDGGVSVSTIGQRCAADGCMPTLRPERCSPRGEVQDFRDTSYPWVRDARYNGGDPGRRRFGAGGVAVR